MKKYNICIPVAFEDYNEFLERLTLIQKENEFVELRLDYIKKLDIEMVQGIFEIIKVKAIATCRSTQEGGKYLGTEEERIKILTRCLTIGFDYVDIELKTAKKYSSPLTIPNSKPKKKKNQLIQQSLNNPKPLLDLNSKNPKTKLILSYHNFEFTENYRNLRKIQSSMDGFHCDVKKIVCQANSNSDVQIMTRLLVSKSDSEKMIVLSMGEYSKYTRVYNLILGNYLTFACIEGQQTAKGQITVKEIAMFLDTLKMNN